MAKQTISSQLDTKKPSAPEALTGYSDPQQWQLQEILAGIAEADAGQVIDHSTVKAMAARWRRPIDLETLPKLL